MKNKLVVRLTSFDDFYFIRNLLIDSEQINLAYSIITDKESRINIKNEKFKDGISSYLLIDLEILSGLEASSYQIYKDIYELISVSKLSQIIASKYSEIIKEKNEQY